MTIILRGSCKGKALTGYFRLRWVEGQDEGLLRAESNLNKVTMAEKSTVCRRIKNEKAGLYTNSKVFPSDPVSITNTRSGSRTSVSHLYPVL